ncbi:MAG: cysteine desulfurase CsdA, partial [Pseudomonadota bacterium]|nr:cysteine desulfurase CsdA [Pseudomonadota bacterium]
MSSVLESQNTLSHAHADISALRKDFPALQQDIYEKPLVYLDSAASTQRP